MLQLLLIHCSKNCKYSGHLFCVSLQYVRNSRSNSAKLCCGRRIAVRIGSIPSLSSVVARSTFWNCLLSSLNILSRVHFLGRYNMSVWLPNNNRTFWGNALTHTIRCYNLLGPLESAPRKSTQTKSPLSFTTMPCCCIYVCNVILLCDRYYMSSECCVYSLSYYCIQNLLWTPDSICMDLHELSCHDIPT